VRGVSKIAAPCSRHEPCPKDRGAIAVPLGPPRCNTALGEEVLGLAQPVAAANRLL